MQREVVIKLVGRPNSGDWNQSLGIARTLQTQLAATDVVCHFDEETDTVNGLNPQSLHALATHLEQESHPETTYIILTAGKLGVDLEPFITDIKSNAKAPIHALWSAHQYFDGLENALEAFDTVILPEHLNFDKLPQAIQDAKEKGELTLVTGVPHHINDAVVAEEKLNLDDEIIIPEAKSYTGVVLGGDAENPDGSWLKFNEENVRQFAARLATLPQEDGNLLLITNGPRTGKACTPNRSATYRDPLVVIDGQEPLDPEALASLDKVSKAFIEALHEQGVHNYRFWDFRAGKSAYMPILATISENLDNVLYLGGESTSMLSESMAVLAPQQLVALCFTNMNEEHHRFVDDQCKLGSMQKLSILQNGYTFEIGEQFSSFGLNQYINGAQVAANAIIEKLNLVPENNELVSHEHSVEETTPHSFFIVKRSFFQYTSFGQPRLKELAETPEALEFDSPKEAVSQKPSILAGK